MRVIMKKVAVLGCSGSVGKTALRVLDNLKDEFRIELLANESQLSFLIRELKARSVKNVFCKNKKYLFCEGKEVDFRADYLSDPETYRDIDIVINGIGGIAGLAPSDAVLKAGKILATANKESIVCAGNFLRKDQNESAKIYPLDSEHSTVWQCLGNDLANVEKIILTASGGAFRDKTKKELYSVTAENALRHPNWIMGKKITIDCATLLNKGLEIIEAKRLFGIPNVHAVLHRESIIHSLVEMKDGALIAGLSNPDMAIPIQYALTYPKRVSSRVRPLCLEDIGALHFEKIDEERFPCFSIAKKVSEYGDYAGTVLVAADEIAVRAFMQNRIRFYDMNAVIEHALQRFGFAGGIHSVDEAYGIYEAVQEYTKEYVEEI